MKKIHSQIILLISISSFMFSQSTDEQYIARFAKIAVEEMQIYKIPASITLAQGLLETADGQSELAQNANNHFGIKCKKEWTGATYTYSDDRPNECFRKYATAIDSYRDHSKFLAERPYYKALFKLNLTDYKAWAHGLKKAGYATNPRYAPLLIAKIEKYNLNQFDFVTPEEVASKLVQLYPSLAVETSEYEVIGVAEVEEEEEIETIADVIEATAAKVDTILTAPEVKIHPLERIERHANKNLKYIRLKRGETLYQISKIYDIPVTKLKSDNDITDETNIKVAETIFLQKKKTKGQKKYYIVTLGDTMHTISQQHGIQLKKLYKRNRMPQGEEPKEGQRLYLKGKKKKNK